MMSSLPGILTTTNPSATDSSEFNLLSLLVGSDNSQKNIDFSDIFSNAENLQRLSEQLRTLSPEQLHEALAQLPEQSRQAIQDLLSGGKVLPKTAEITPVIQEATQQLEEAIASLDEANRQLDQVFSGTTTTLPRELNTLLIGSMPGIFKDGQISMADEPLANPADQVVGELPTAQMVDELLASQMVGELPASQMVGELPTAQVDLIRSLVARFKEQLSEETSPDNEITNDGALGLLVNGLAQLLGDQAGVQTTTAGDENVTTDPSPLLQTVMRALQMDDTGDPETTDLEATVASLLAPALARAPSVGTPDTSDSALSRLVIRAEGAHTFKSTLTNTWHNQLPGDHSATQVVQNNNALNHLAEQVKLISEATPQLANQVKNLGQMISMTTRTLAGDESASLVQRVEGNTQFSSMLSGLTSSDPSGIQGGKALSPAPLGLELNAKGWDHALANRVAWMVGRDLQQASLHISPRHLGPIDVHLKMQDDIATVHFITPHGQVKEAIEAAIPRLREMFADNSLQLANVDVGQRGAQDQRTLAEGFQHSDRETAGSEGKANYLAGKGDDVISEETLNRRERLLSGLVDDYA